MLYTRPHFHKPELKKSLEAQYQHIQNSVDKIWKEGELGKIGKILEKLNIKISRT